MVSDESQSEPTETPGGHFTTTENSLNFIKTPDTFHGEYSLPEVFVEEPLMHYTHGGNVLQILRFGLHSNNFKNRLSEYRYADLELDEIAKQITGFHYRQGGSYQGKDSISLSMWNGSMYTGPRNVLLLINPNTRVWGSETQRESTGYGHGIRIQNVEGDYEIGNAIAYRDELAACNVIPPIDIRAVVVDKHTQILRDMSLIVQEHAKTYCQERQVDASGTTENMLATVRLLANLTSSKELTERADELERQLPSLSYRDVVMEVSALQKSGLQKFVGERDLTETTLRQAMLERFGVQFLEKPET